MYVPYLRHTGQLSPSPTTLQLCAVCTNLVSVWRLHVNHRVGHTKARALRARASRGLHSAAKGGEVPRSRPIGARQKFQHAEVPCQCLDKICTVNSIRYPPTANFTSSVPATAFLFSPVFSVCVGARTFRVKTESQPHEGVPGHSAHTVVELATVAHT